MEIPVYKTKGIILKKTDLSDTDRLLTVYTEKFGKILVRAKGIGKKESKLKSLIEPFNVYEFSLARSKTIDVLAGSYPIKEFNYLRRDLENLLLAIYFAELVDKLIPAPEGDEKIWMLLIRAFEALDSSAASSPQTRGGLPARNDKRSVSGGRWGDESKASPPPAPPQLRRGGMTLDKLKEAFEERFLGYLGHPSFASRGKRTEREKLNYLQSLAGEEINSVKFLRSLSLIS